jgi:hypothetical protein
MSNRIIHNVPDISYHLVFCFLSLKELTLIAQCNQEFSRLVTAPSFLNMFRRDTNTLFTTGNYVEKQIQLLSINPFRHTIRCINMRCRLSDTIYLIHFHSLVSLQLEIPFEDSQNPEFDITPVFQALAPSLRELKVFLYFNISYKYFDNGMRQIRSSYIGFQKALSLLTSLTFLSLFGGYVNYFSDISFLSHMKQLQTFHFNRIHFSSFQDIFNVITTLPQLTHLESDVLFDSSRFMDQTNEPCKDLEQSKLKHLDIFYSNSKDKEHEYEHLLNQLTHLKTIAVCTIGTNIPFSFGKWIRHLEMSFTTLTREQVHAIHDFPQLKSLKITTCSLEQNNPIDTLLLKLEELYLISSNGFTCFSSLSKCVKLKTLSLVMLRGLGDIKEFDLLSNCKQLEYITIQNCHISYERISSNMKQALKNKAPYNDVFPRLKKVEISHY